MARSLGFSTMLVTFLAIGAIVVLPSLAQDNIQEAEAPAPVAEIKDELSPEPAPGYYDYISQCMDHLDEKCGKEIYSHVFQDGKISKVCCHALLKLGYSCHTGLVKTILSLPRFKPYAAELLPKSDHAWNRCTLVLHDQAPSPSPIA